MVYRVGELQIDCSMFEIRRRNAVVAVEPKVYDVILYLARNRDRVVTKTELLSHVWRGTLVGESSLARCVSIARSVLGNDARILSRYKRGYLFIGDVVEETWPGVQLSDVQS